MIDFCALPQRGYTNPELDPKVEDRTDEQMKTFYGGFEISTSGICIRIYGCYWSIHHRTMQIGSRTEPWLVHFRAICASPGEAHG